MKNDITYEYRVFTHRLIDVESMEVGICTSKVINEIKPKDKINGRFFHTSDTDEWFFCWNNELQKLNLKGDSDINAALAEVEKLIADANAAVEDAKKTATEAKDAAAEAKAAVESIDKLEEAVENKADKGDVEDVVNALKTKQDVITDISDIRANAELAKSALQSVPDEYVTETELAGMNYATVDQVNAKQDVIADLSDIRDNANLAKSALQSVPAEYVTETELAGMNYATVDQVNAKQDAISDLETIRIGAAAGATALQASDLDGYLTANSDVIVEINNKIDEINTLLGDATALTNTILNA